MLDLILAQTVAAAGISGSSHFRRRRCRALDQHEKHRRSHGHGSRCSRSADIRQRHQLEPSNIAHVLVKATTREADILSDPSKYQPTTEETADPRLPCCIAAALVDGQVLRSSFSEEKLQDPKIWAMLEKIIVDSEIDALFPKMKLAVVVNTTTDGAKHPERVDDAQKSPENPMSDVEMTAKIHANAQDALSAARRDEIVTETLELGKRNPELKIDKDLELLISDLSNP